jgi:hypothetical protein
MVLTWGVVFLTSKPLILRQRGACINSDDTDRTPSEPITSLIACHQSIEMAPVKLPPLFIATIQKERVLRISQKESRDKGTKQYAHLVWIASSSCLGRFVRRVEQLSKWILPVTLIVLSASTATI